MTRQREALCRRLLALLSGTCVLGAIALAAHTFVVPPATQMPELPALAAPQPRPGQPLLDDPRAARMANLKLSRTVVPQAAVVRKITLPELNTLVRLVGVLSYGAPQDNEALIEVLRSRQTKSYRVGDSIPEIKATVTKIDSGVTLDYDGKLTRLEIRSGEQVQSGELAAPGERTGAAAAGHERK
jgi:hypothetical protein